MIVDDEAVIREGLRGLIDWAASGFDEVAEASNAREALEKIEESPPDLIITDIFMPQMSGLEFARLVRSRRPSIRFIILTGYEKFEYAKEAISVGVASYLVKPIFPEELKRAVEEQRDEIAAERSSRDWMEAARKRLNDYRPIIAEKFWDDLIEGTLHRPEDIRERAAAADVRHAHDVYACVALQILRLPKVYRRFGEKELPLVRFAIRNIVEEMHPGVVLHVSEAPGTVLTALLCAAADAEEWRRTADAIERTLKIDIAIGAGRACSALEQIHASAGEALDCVKYMEMLDQTGFMRFEDIPAWKKDRVEYPYEEEKQLLEAVRYRDRLPEGAAEPFFRKLIAQHSSPEMIRLACIQLLGAVYRLADEYGIESLPSYQESASRLEELPSLARKQRQFEEWLREITSGKNAQHASFVAQLVDRARQLIDERYADPMLSVAMIAQVLCITPNYLSRIFHQKTGTTCVEAITRRRLEEAKRLLALTPLKSYEIAEKVGYANAHYFSFMFKKNVGCSPSEFRERGGGGRPS